MATKTRGAERFAQMLADLGLSQREAARRIGNRSQGYVSYLLSGERTADLPAALGIQELSKEWAHGPIDPSEWKTPGSGSDDSADDQDTNQNDAGDRTGTEG